MSEMFESEFLYILKTELPKRKTPIYNLFSKYSPGVKLGEIKWFGAWRKYCFYPESDTIFDNKCLNYIIEFLDFVNKKK